MRCFTVGAILAAATMSNSVPVVRASLTGWARPQAGPCTPAIESTRPLALPDGSLVSVDANSAATDGHAILLAGPYLYMWRAELSGDRSGVPTTAVGVLRDSAGRVSLVPAPVARPFQFSALRVAASGTGAWHFLLLAGAQGGAPVRAPGRVDSASIWYGLFDGRRWRQLVKIAPASSARLMPEFTSELVADHAGLAFAYAYDRSRLHDSNPSSAQGIVLLSSHGTKWKSDTLTTWDEPTSVQLVPDTAGRLLAVFSQAYFTNGRPRGPVLFSAVHDAVWRQPRRIWKPPSGYVAAPLRIARARDMHSAPLTLISWLTASAGGVDADTLTWGVVRSDSIRRIGPSVGADPWDGVVVSPNIVGGAIWLTRSDTAHNELRVIRVRDTTVKDIGRVKLPFDNRYLVGGSLADGNFFVATMGVHLARPQSATTYLTELTVRCPAARK